MKLAAALSDMDSITGNGLQDMFDVLGSENGLDDSMYQHKPMMLYRELIGEEAAPVAETFDQTKGGKEHLFDLFDMLAQLNQAGESEAAEKPVELPKPVLEVVKPTVAVTQSTVVLRSYNAGGRASKRSVTGQMALF